MNLVHLVSEQTLQNLLPLLALRPACVIQICSADERFARALRLAVYVGNPAAAPPRLAAPDLPDHLHWTSPAPASPGS